MPLHEPTRQKHRKEAEDALQEAKEKLLEIVEPFHKVRLARVEEAIATLVDKRGALQSPVRCDRHADYKGITNRSRSKCEGCRLSYEAGAAMRAEWKELGTRITKGKNKLKSIGPEFKYGSDDHWRVLLFNGDIGCKLKPMRRTKVRKDPTVDDDVIEALQKRYPDNPYLRYRVAIQSCSTRLSTRLAVKADDGGRVHFAYSMSHSGPGRISSGKDDEEYDKIRDSAGNGQNIAPRDRAIYRAERGFCFVESDWSQIEARRQATLAGEERMLQAWRDGADIHALNGAALARALGVDRCTPEQACKLTFRFGGEWHTYRYAAKRMTHGWNYGMGAKHTADLYGIPVHVAQRLIDAYFENWPMIAAYHEKILMMANRDRQLTNSWGRVYPFFKFSKDKKTGQWGLTDPNEALSFMAQSDVSDLCKRVLPPMDKAAALWGGELLNTKHDSYTSMIPIKHAGDYIVLAKKVMEHEYIPGFTCPSDFEVGLNWGPYHSHEKCKPECAQAENLDGMRKWKGESWFLKSDVWSRGLA
jgi:DNA polymerase-1